MVVFRAFWREELAEGVSTGAILMALGAVIALAVLGEVGKAIYAYFQHFGSCLNGC
jgi:Flp pilus assembly pilin Flp